jgi:hypothetical protein
VPSNRARRCDAPQPPRPTAPCTARTSIFFVYVSITTLLLTPYTPRKRRVFAAQHPSFGSPDLRDRRAVVPSLRSTFQHLPDQHPSADMRFAVVALALAGLLAVASAGGVRKLPDARRDLVSSRDDDAIRHGQDAASRVDSRSLAAPEAPYVEPLPLTARRNSATGLGDVPVLAFDDDFTVSAGSGAETDAIPAPAPVSLLSRILVMVGLRAECAARVTPWVVLYCCLAALSLTCAARSILSARLRKERAQWKARRGGASVPSPSPSTSFAQEGILDAPGGKTAPASALVETAPSCATLTVCAFVCDAAGLESDSDDEAASCGEGRETGAGCCRRGGASEAASPAAPSCPCSLCRKIAEAHHAGGGSSPAILCAAQHDADLVVPRSRIIRSN